MPLRRVDVFDHIPLIAMGECGISGVLERLESFFRQTHLLGLFVEAAEIALIVALYGIAPQAVEIPSCLQREAVVLAAGAARNGSLTAIAVPPHARKLGREIIMIDPLSREISHTYRNL